MGPLRDPTGMLGCGPSSPVKRFCILLEAPGPKDHSPGQESQGGVGMGAATAEVSWILSSGVRVHPGGPRKRGSPATYPT